MAQYKQLGPLLSGETIMEGLAHPDPESSSIEIKGWRRACARYVSRHLLPLVGQSSRSPSKPWAWVYLWLSSSSPHKIVGADCL